MPSIEEFCGTVWQGDCIDLMQQLPEESVDLVVTSPPYNLKNTVGGGFKGTFASGKWQNAGMIAGYDVHNDKMPHAEYVKWQRDCLSNMMRVIKNDGAIFYNHKWRVQNGLLQDRHDIVDGFPVRQIIIWQRAGGMNFNKGYFLPTYEVIYLITKPKFKLAPNANAAGDVWRINQEMHNPHPAPFPAELAARCIKSTDAEIILDPFLGSGSTAVAATEAGRKWIGIDISPEYCEMARERIDAEIEQRQLRDRPESQHIQTAA